MEGDFLAVNKNYLGKGLKSLDLLIFAQIEEFQRNNLQCYMTNDQFSEKFGESVSSVKRSLDKLEEKKLIIRKTRNIRGNGRANTERTISLGDKIALTLFQCEAQKTQCEGQIESMRGSNPDNGRFKNDECEVHNEPVKDNLKENIKENLKDNRPKKEIANANDKGKTKGRTIRDLTYEEGNAICDAIRNNKEKYADLQRKYGLEFGSVTKDFPKQWQSEKNAREYAAELKREEERMKKEPQIDYSRIYVKPKSQEEIEHERMMDNLLLEFLDDDDQDESETIRSKALSSISSSSNRCYGNRTLGDISIEEGDEIVKDICENGLELEAIWEKYKFKPNTIMCDFPNAWKRMRKIRVCEREGKEVNWDELFAEDPDDDENDIWGDNAEKPESLRIIEERKREQEREEEELWSQDIVG